MVLLGRGRAVSARSAGWFGVSGGGILFWNSPTGVLPAASDQRLHKIQESGVIADALSNSKTFRDY